MRACVRAGALAGLSIPCFPPTVARLAVKPSALALRGLANERVQKLNSSISLGVRHTGRNELALRERPES